MAQNRIYLVTAKGSETKRLVRAPNTAQAVRHVAANTFTVAVASQDDLVRLIADGVKVENSGDTPGTALLSSVSVTDGLT